MTVDELKDYLIKLSDNGHGNARVSVANKSWNPIAESDDIVSALVLNGKMPKAWLFYKPTKGDRK